MTLTDAVASKQAAWAMCATFGISVTSPKQQVALPTTSRHNSGNAVDLKLTHYVGKTMKNADGEDVVINSFQKMVLVGRTYGVKYYTGENMHWSDTGH